MMYTHVPRRAGFAEACWCSHGKRQGLAGILDHPSKAWTNNVRARRRAAGYRPRGVRSRRRQIADRNTFHRPPRRGGRLMKATDARAKTDDELTGELDVLGKEIFNLRFQRANGQLENTDRVRQLPRSLARTTTLLGERPRATRGGKI